MIIRKKCFEEFVKVYRCDCMGEYLQIHKFKGETQISLGKLYGSCDLKPSLFGRIKTAFAVIFKYRDTCMDDVILTRETARELGEDLIKLTNEKPKDMEFGNENNRGDS